MSRRTEDPDSECVTHLVPSNHDIQRWPSAPAGLYTPAAHLLHAHPWPLPHFHTQSKGQLEGFNQGRRQSGD